MAMTPDQRAEIARLLDMLYISAEEARSALNSPQVFLNGGYIEDYPDRSITLLRALVDCTYL